MLSFCIEICINYCLSPPSYLPVGAQDSTKWPRNVVPYTIGSNFTGMEREGEQEGERLREREGEGGRESRPRDTQIIKR